MLCKVTTNRRFGNFMRLAFNFETNFSIFWSRSAWLRLAHARIFCLLWLAFSAATALGNDKNGASAVSPTNGVIKLYNSKNFDGLTTWLSDTKYEDPRGVFSIEDGIIHLTGDGFGYVRTNERYRDYHLIIEFKWGSSKEA